MSTPTRTRALLGALLLTGGLLFLPGVASAQDSPTCSDFATQAQAQEAFDADRTGLADLDRDGDGRACESLVDRATTGTGSAGSNGVDGVNGVAGTDTGSDTSTAAGTGDVTVTSLQGLLDQVAALQCGTDYAAQLQTLQDEVTALATTDPNRTRFADALAAQQTALNDCLATSTDLDPTADDGSVPITSGSQVSVVPEGSAETGGA